MIVENNVTKKVSHVPEIIVDHLMAAYRLHLASTPNLETKCLVRSAAFNWLFSIFVAYDYPAGGCCTTSRQESSTKYAAREVRCSKRSTTRTKV
jgi:hypothetical protein